MERPEYVLSGEVARLLPTYSETQKEGRSTSILLATMMAVAPFAKSLLHPIGVRLGKTTRVGCFTEVVFKSQPKQAKDRPDGLIVAETGKRQWRAIVEAKVGTAELDATQLHTYLGIAKENGIDAIITISNQFAALPTHHPVEIERRAGRGIGVFHWSWTSVLTQAMLLLASEENLNPSERYLLAEFVRYLKHDKSGLTRFDRMNPDWKDLVSAVNAQMPLRKDMPMLVNSVSSWFQEERDLSLRLTQTLRQSVTVKLSRSHSTSPAERHTEVCGQVVADTCLHSAFEIPNAAAPLVVTADIARRSIICSMTLAAPTDRKAPSARVNWLLRQLSGTTVGSIFVRAHWFGRSQPTQAPLERLKDDPNLLNNPSGNKEIKSLEVIYIADIGAKFGQTTKFISELEAIVPRFYDQVGQKLRAWVPPPPKYRPSPDVAELAVDVSENQQPEASDETTGQSQSQEHHDDPPGNAPNLSIESAFESFHSEPEIPEFLRRN